MRGPHGTANVRVRGEPVAVAAFCSAHKFTAPAPVPFRGGKLPAVHIDNDRISVRALFEERNSPTIAGTAPRIRTPARGGVGFIPPLADDAGTCCMM